MAISTLSLHDSQLHKRVQQNLFSRCLLHQIAHARWSTRKTRRRTHDLCSACGANASSKINHIAFCSTFKEVDDVLFRRAVKLMMSGNPRNTVGLCGLPGSGKSTAAVKLAQRVNDGAGQNIAIAVPMDGFHLYRRELDSLANAAEAHARRGAAFTFNAPKFVQRIRDISRAATEPGSPPVLLPSFDHEFGDPVEKDICVLPEHRLVIVEGIYVLRECVVCPNRYPSSKHAFSASGNAPSYHDEDPWNELEDIFVETWMLRVEKKVAMDNVFRRKIATGRSAEEARHQVEHNDGRNADEILSKSLRPDFLVDASAAHLIAAEQQQPS